MLKFLKSIRAKHTLDKVMKNSEKVEVPEEIEELAESIGGGYWNYRWFQLTYKDKYGTETWYEMRETYYDKNDEVFAWSSNCSTFTIQSVEEARELENYAEEAMHKPILKIVKTKEGNEKVVELKKTLLDIKEK